MSEEKKEKTSSPVITEDFERYVTQGLNTEQEQSQVLPNSKAEQRENLNTLSETQQLLEIVANQQKGSALGDSAAAAAEEISSGDTASVSSLLAELESMNKHPALTEQAAKASAELEQYRSGEQQIQDEPAEVVPEESIIKQKQEAVADNNARNLSETRQLLEIVAHQQKGSALGDSAAAAAEEISSSDTASASSVLAELESMNKHPALTEGAAKASAELEQYKSAEQQAPDVHAAVEPEENTIEPHIEQKQETEADDDAKPSEQVNRLAGSITEHGKAPYEHNPENRQSYYVTLENADGETSTAWGMDIERAVKESGAKEGEHIELENQGRQPVTINRPVKDEKGNVVRTKQINTHGNKLDVKGESIQDRERDTKELVHEHPDLVNEVAAIKVAEKFSQRQFNNDADRDRFMNKVRTQIAGNVSKGQQSPEVKLREERVIGKESDNER